MRKRRARITLYPQLTGLLRLFQVSRYLLIVGSSDREFFFVAGSIPQLIVVCPAQIVPVGMRQTGTRGAGDGTRKEAQSGAGSEHVAADRSGGGQREDDTAGMQRSGDRGADLLSLA